MVEALRYFCTSFLSWLSFSVPDFVDKIDIVDFGTVFLGCFAILVFIHSIGGKNNG